MTSHRSKHISFFLIVASVVLWMLTMMSIHCTATSREPDDPMLAALSLKEPVTLCGETVPVENFKVVERFEKEMLVALGNRHQVILWLKRSTRYFPYIEKILAQNSLHEDLKYLAVAESALRMHAGSPKGAMGVWQLMPQTARRYGLAVNRSFDERRNVYLSTPAAVSYLKALFEQFGSWSLAMAAYNMGEDGLEAEILEQGIADYYRLYLSLETQRFVFRILAIKRIMEAPENYGFHFSASDAYPPVVFSTVQISTLGDIPLRLIAEAAQTEFKTIKDLNPELRGYYLAAGTRQVSVPVSGKAGFQDRLAERIAAETDLRNQRTYVVKKGDTLSGIAKKFDVPLAAILIWNRFGVRTVIHPGQKIVVYRGTAEPDNVSSELEAESDG